MGALAIDPSAAACETEQSALDAILTHVHQHTGVDFSRYRPATVRRRVLNRMISVGASDFEQYLHILESDRAEPLRLLERITIKVSRFYRNAVTFDALRHTVLPELRRARERTPLRIWSAGCGNGEEPYTLAMLLKEAGLSGTIEATDIDPAALGYARAATYDTSALAELPSDLQQRYLEPVGPSHVVRSEIRELVRFSLHDLSADTPPLGIAQFDLVCCRNVLIYFDRAVQERALQRVRSAVRESGFLCLGESEWPPPSIMCTLEALPSKTRIFRDLRRPAPWLIK